MSPIVQIPGTEGVGTLGDNGPRVSITKDMAKLFSEFDRLDPTQNFKKTLSSAISTESFRRGTRRHAHSLTLSPLNSDHRSQLLK